MLVKAYRKAAWSALLWKVCPGGTVAVGTVGLGTILLAWQANKLVQRQNDLIIEQNSLVNTQNTLVEAQRRSALIEDLTSIMESIEREKLRQESNPENPENPEGVVKFILPKLLAGRVVALSKSLRPYRYVSEETGKLTDALSSPERGYLLTSLLSAGVSITSLPGADFSYAELQNADLHGVDLRSVNLRSANLSGAILMNANLAAGDLRNANLSNAILWRPSAAEYAAKRYGKLVKGTGGRVSDLGFLHVDDDPMDIHDQRYTEAFEHAITAFFDSANLSGAQLTKANLSGMLAQGVDFTRADLTSCIIEGLYINISGANIYSATLDAQVREKLLSSGAVELNPMQWREEKERFRASNEAELRLMLHLRDVGIRSNIARNDAMIAVNLARVKVNTTRIALNRAKINARVARDNLDPQGLQLAIEQRKLNEELELARRELNDQENRLAEAETRFRGATEVADFQLFLKCLHATLAISGRIP